MDDKCSLMGILESLEWLLSEDFVPERPLLIAFGHDEEIGGRGALAIANYIKQQYSRLHAVLDEGGVIADGIVPGLGQKAVALVGTAEKGFGIFQLKYTGATGHASMPDKTGAIDKISCALQKIHERNSAFRLTPPLKGFFRYLGPEMPWTIKMAFSNVWLFRRWIYRIYSGKASTRALVSTTFAPTSFHAGNKSNTLASTATATINARILPGETVESCRAMLQNIIDDPEVRVEQLYYAQDPPAVTDYRSDQFNYFGKIIRSVFPGILVSPYLSIATTDSRHYDGFSDHIFRFLPVPFKENDLPRIHGHNERISILDYRNLIRFYRTFIVHFSK